ncbi:hypothetical protein SAY87_031150 [Trapa incisa]|uniref:DNA topoisomerase 2 n=1 Tax=Trapa incisa TaxID=236973 RepID=A0AAN7KUG2_9MYRT|nr:hypothetical protein SAY87_031150 [Trapa incisa]
MAATKKLPLQSSHSVNIAPAAPTGPRKTIEETYQKKSQLEHILLRPDTYIGSIENHTQTLWVYENEEMVNRPVTYVPGLYKIFDEILVNAADNKQRDPRMDSLKVSIDVEQNLISVYNNGDGVPVEIHQEEQVYVPELIFGHLLTSSNYDDSVKKTTGGRNGYGAKLTNIFSTEFVIETADGKRQKKYKQVFSNNMGKKSEPIITKCKEGENWTKVSFKPDLFKFKMSHLEDDVVALMKKRVVDMAGCLGKTVKVELNGKRVPVKTFPEYVSLYLSAAKKNKPDTPLPRMEETVNDRWEVCVSLSEGQFQQVSFVNSIATIKGGTHVDCVTNQIANYVMNVVNKKNKTANLKAHNVKNHLWVFVNSLIDNPAFDSQTKETLTLRQSNFGSKCELSDKFLHKVANSGIVDTLLSWANFKQSKDLKKTDGMKKENIRGIPKLEDANDAGGRNSDKCTLILTEGDSAKALAMAGLSVVGRDRYGVFPLRGKLLNVREASHSQIMDNKEIQYLKQILGLQQNKQYDSVKTLRYGHMMIMTDQDHDGSHIKGLLINFIHSFWPSLLKVPSFMVEFITPIVKATHKNGKEMCFYTMPEYESWKESLRNNASGWSIKYYKGLGTSTSKEGKQYFQNLDKHKKDFVWADEKDGEAIELAFSKKKIEARKNWLRQFEPGTFLDQKEKRIKYSDFVNKELILFSMADLQRSIPSMVDGLKPGQRKILFCSFKRNFVKEAKVVQFSGYVSEHSAYHHGDQSLAAAIIGMAQDFVGSNNINLLVPSGQFGTRNMGGKDHASPRYIFTRLSPVTRFLFPKDDDNLLDYLNEDGVSIEPTWYMPIIPTVLVNGSEGIGTGWSSYVPNYNPRDIINNVRRLLNGEMTEPMDPWYRGFKGTIEKTASKEAGNSYTIYGIMEEINETTLRITELPIRRWTQDYREFLESLVVGDKDKIKEPFIKEFKQYSDDISVHFEIVLSEENMMVAKQEGLLKKFKLTSSISTSNMHLFDAKGVIKKYDTPEQILEEFFPMRLEFYEKRRKFLLDNLKLELLKLDNKVRFILGVVSGEIIVNNKKRADLFLELQQKGFTPFPKKTKTLEAAIAGASEDSEDTENSENVGSGEGKASDYEYLLSMAIGSLTREKVQELCDERDKMLGEVEGLKRTTPKDLWLKDLASLEKEIDELDKNDAEARKMSKSKGPTAAGTKVSTRQPPKAPPRAKKATANLEAVGETAEMPPTNVSMVTDNAAPVAKPRGRGGAKKPPAAAAAKKSKKAAISDDDDEDEEVLDLKERLARYNLESSPENSTAMDIDAPQARATTKEPSKRAAAAKKVVLSDTSDEESGKDEVSDDEDFEVEPVVNDKKVAKRPSAAAASKAAAATKRHPAKKVTLGQKVLTSMLEAQESSGISPEKKVRRMRTSPFNKKSSSVLSGNSEEDRSEVVSNEVEEDVQIIPPSRATRPKRASQNKRYVISDSETEDDDDEDIADEDSDFSEDEDSE